MPWGVLDHPSFHSQGTHFLTQVVLAGTPALLPLAQPWPASELHRAWGPGSLRKRKWRPWDVGGRAGRGPTQAPRARPLCPHPSRKTTVLEMKTQEPRLAPRLAQHSVGWLTGRFSIC